MTRRICAIGNSHLAALILGWKQVAGHYPDVVLTFFGSAGRTMADLGVADGALRPRTEELKRLLAELDGTPDAIHPEDHDEFWLCGLGLGPHRVMDVYTRCWAEGLRPRRDRVPVSDALFVELARATMLDTLALRIHAMLRTLTGKPIRAIPQPQPAGVIERWRPALDRGDAPALAGLLRRTFARLAEDGIEVMPQPPATLAGPIVTHADHGRGSMRLRMDTAHPADDVGHMNGGYGALVLADLLGPVPGTAAAPAGGDMRRA